MSRAGKQGSPPLCQPSLLKVALLPTAPVPTYFPPSLHAPLHPCILECRSPALVQRSWMIPEPFLHCDL